MKDELGIEVTPERIEELRQHFEFRSDSAARDVGLILNAQQAEIERLRDELAFQSKNAADAHAERAHQFRRSADAREALGHISGILRRHYCVIRRDRAASMDDDIRRALGIADAAQG